MRFRDCCLMVLLPLAFISCQHQEYDLSRGIDKEITLFSEEVSLPLGNIGPLTPKSLVGKDGLPDMISSFVQEDEDGYLVNMAKGTIYSGAVGIISMSLPDPTLPADVPIPDNNGSIESMAGAMGALGFGLSPQVFTLQARNPLTEEISFSGKLTLSDEDDAPLAAEEFSKVPVAASKADAKVLRIEKSAAGSFANYKLENMVLHLPASITEKDPSGGFGSIMLDYQYKGYFFMSADFPMALPLSLDNLNAPLARYKVKEARICMDVSNEIPISLELASVKVLVKQMSEKGREVLVPSEDVTVTPGLKVNSGRSGSPVISPLEIVIQAREGTTIPDISGLELELKILAPDGDGDNRINMNQSVSFNNIRAKVSGGITIPNL